MCLRSPAAVDIPDEFYEATEADVRAAMASSSRQLQQMESRVLMTRDMRERAEMALLESRPKVRSRKARGQGAKYFIE